MDPAEADTEENRLSQRFSQLSSDELGAAAQTRDSQRNNANASTLSIASVNIPPSQARRYMVSSSQSNLPEIEILSQELRTTPAAPNDNRENEQRDIDKIKQEIEQSVEKESMYAEMPKAQFVHKPIPQYYNDSNANHLMAHPHPMVAMMPSWGDVLQYPHQHPATMPSCSHYQTPASILHAAANMIPSNNEQHYQYRYAAPVDMNGFRVIVVHEQKNSLNWNFVAGVNVDKSRVLYCKKDLLVPFHIYCPPSLNNGDVQLEIRVEFSEESARNKVIQRCPNHRTDDASELRTFFMRHTTNDGRAQYKDSIGNVIVMPLAREGPSSIDLSFTCFTSCPTLAKYPIRVVFSLYRMHRMDTDYPLAESWFALKVCANPARDVENTRDGITCDDEMYNTLLNVKANRPRAKKRKFSMPQLDEEEQCSPAGQLMRSNGMPSTRSSALIHEPLVDITVKQSDALKILPALTKQAIRDRNVLIRREHEGGAASPFKGISTLNRSTSIRSWLSLPSLELSHYLDLFMSRNIRTLGELMSAYNSRLFGDMGIPQPVCDKLNSYYLNWAYEVQFSELEYQNASTTKLH